MDEFSIFAGSLVLGIALVFSGRADAQVPTRGQVTDALSARNHGSSVGFLGECETTLRRGDVAGFARCRESYFCGYRTLSPDFDLGCTYLGSFAQTVAAEREADARNAESRRAQAEVEARAREAVRLREQEEARRRAEADAVARLAAAFDAAAPVVDRMALSVGTTVRWQMGSSRHVLSLRPTANGECAILLDLAQQLRATAPQPSVRCRGDVELFTPNAMAVCVATTASESPTMCVLLNGSEAGGVTPLGSWVRDGTTTREQHFPGNTNSVVPELVATCAAATDAEEARAAWRRLDALDVAPDERRECEATYVPSVLATLDHFDRSDLRLLRAAVEDANGLQRLTGLTADSRSAITSTISTLDADVARVVAHNRTIADGYFRASDYGAVHLIHSSIFVDAGETIADIAGRTNDGRRLRDLDAVVRAIEQCTNTGDVGVALLGSSVEVLRSDRAYADERAARAVVVRCEQRLRRMTAEAEANAARLAAQLEEQARIHGRWRWGDLHRGIVELEFRPDLTLVVEMPLSSVQSVFGYVWSSSREIIVIDRNGNDAFTLSVERLTSTSLSVSGVPLRGHSGPLAMTRVQSP